MNPIIEVVNAVSAWIAASTGSIKLTRSIIRNVKRNNREKKMQDEFFASENQIIVDGEFDINEEEEEEEKREYTNYFHKHLCHCYSLIDNKSGRLIEKRECQNCISQSLEISYLSKLIPKKLNFFV